MQLEEARGRITTAPRFLLPPKALLIAGTLFVERQTQMRVFRTMLRRVRLVSFGRPVRRICNAIAAIQLCCDKHGN